MLGGRGSDRPVPRRGPHQRRDRRGLFRGRRRDHRSGARAARETGTPSCRCSTSTSSAAVRSKGPYIRSTLAIDKNATREDALIDIYRVMRPGEPPTLETAEELFNSLFFNSERYDLSAVGRVKMNSRLALTPTTRCGPAQGRHPGDPEHAGGSRGRPRRNRRHRSSRKPPRPFGRRADGGSAPRRLLRMERAIRERMSSVEIDTVMPHDLINAKPAAAAVREFFGSSQLSQFMDQTNPLSRDHPQAASVGARPGRSDARARRLRGARRAPDALRPDLPDRDPGRPEYRPDQHAWRPMPGSTSTASSRAPTARSSTAG